MNVAPTAEQSSPDRVVLAIERPHRSLLTYYTLLCVPLLIVPPVGVVLWVVNYFRYHTMRYRFGAEGVSMSWGILFRREVLLNYARIQDIHLVSNVIERWLGLARIQVQTASGTAGAEMTIEGLLEYDQVRDFLYAHMRGTRDLHSAPGASVPSHPAVAGAPDELAATLQAIALELKQIREALEVRKS
jgi:putative membrane protein